MPYLWPLCSNNENKQFVSWIINSIVSWTMCSFINIIIPSDLRTWIFVDSILKPLQNGIYFELKSLPIHASDVIIIWHFSFKEIYKCSKSFTCSFILLIFVCRILRLSLCLDKFVFISLMHCNGVVSESKNSNSVFVEVIISLENVQ